MTITSLDELEMRRNHLFSALSQEQFDELRNGVSVRSVEQGEHLFEEGNTAEHFYLVRRGQIKLYRLSPTGQEKVIEIIRPGQTFAEALMFMDIPAYPVNAQVLGDAELYAITSRAFRKVLSHSVEACYHLLADLSMRLRQRLNEIDSLTLQNASLRVVNYLIYLLPETCRDCADIILPAAKNIIASRLSITPETLSRILNSLSANGLISVEGLQIKVHDVERLRAYGH